MDTVGVSPRRLGGSLERESRLPGPAGSCQCDEPRVVAVEELDDLAELALATEEGSRWDRKVPAARVWKRPRPDCQCWRRAWACCRT